jgi:hypothetical protein
MAPETKLLAAALIAVSLTALAGDMPWAFNTERGQGYAIDLLSADPAPGTPLVRGSSVTVKIEAKYSMTVAKEGSIFLVIQDDKNKKVEAKIDPKQVAATDAGGTVTLSATFAEIPKVKEIRIFVPLFPKGLAEETGEIVLRYPVVRKK